MLDHRGRKDDSIVSNASRRLLQEGRQIEVEHGIDLVDLVARTNQRNRRSVFVASDCKDLLRLWRPGETDDGVENKSLLYICPFDLSCDDLGRSLPEVCDRRFVESAR